MQLALLKPEHFNLSVEEQDVLRKNRVAYIASAHKPPLAVTRQLFATSQKECPKIDQIKDTSSTLLCHLWTFKNRDCSDPRDRIYALKSMALDLKELIVPDYSEGPGIVYAKATRLVIEHHKKLDIIGMCLTPEDSDPGSPERPSWTPDFASMAAQRPFTSLTMFLSGHDPYYSASTKVSEAVPLPSDDPSELRLQGHSVGSVIALGFEGAKNWQDMVIRSSKLAGHFSPANSDHDIDRTEVFWRTLITDRTSNNQPARADVEGRQFEFWWNTLTGTAPRGPIYFHDYNQAFLLHWCSRSFFTTDSGHIGLGPAAAKVGDHVGLLAGSQVPFILRSTGQKFQVVGEAYVHGIMDGKYWEKLENESTPQMEFALI